MSIDEFNDLNLKLAHARWAEWCERHKEPIELLYGLENPQPDEPPEEFLALVMQTAGRNLMGHLVEATDTRTLRLLTIGAYGFSAMPEGLE